MEAGYASGLGECDQFFGVLSGHPVEVGEEIVAELRTVYVNS